MISQVVTCADTHIYKSVQTSALEPITITETNGNKERYERLNSRGELISRILPEQAH
jgi:hypothetical protein